MKRLFLLFLLLKATLFVIAQPVSQGIPRGAILYNEQGLRVNSPQKATYYRVLSVDRKGQRLFHDYYISGELRAEKYYLTLNKANANQTILTGVCRTFYKSGRVESVMLYDRGKANGRAVSFFPNGKVGMKLFYRHGVLDGACYTFNENGQLEYTTIWKNGLKVKELKGGRDYYIDSNTKKDAFCEQFGGEKERIEQNPKETEYTHSSSVNNAHVKSNGELNSPKIHSEHLSLKKESKKPVVEDVASSQLPKGIFSFSYLYDLLSNSDHSTQEMHFFDTLSAHYHLEVFQMINGYGSQKELIYHHSMDYDVHNGLDKVTGNNPRQIGFWGNLDNNRFTVQRINLFTWSEKEMLLFAKEAISNGYKVLGGGDYKEQNANFILEPSGGLNKNMGRDVVLTFTFEPNLYAGLYHIQMDIR